MRRFCRIFQKADIDFTMLKPCADSTIASMKLYKDQDIKQVETITINDLEYYTISGTNTAQRSYSKHKFKRNTLLL